MDPSKLSAKGRRLFGMIEFDEEEQLVAEVHKDVFGLFLIYFMGTFVATALFIIFFALPALAGNGDSLGTGLDLETVRPILMVLGGVLILLTVVVMGIGAYLYQSNVVIITSEKIAQFLYRTIFDRKISQLSIGDVQDVTVTQVGLFARLFHYGTIVIETAGEQQNYTFTYAPDPYETAKAIVGAHELNLRKYGN